MHHYQHHIGDFNNATRHLTRVERSVYRDLIELYYDTEQPLIGDEKALMRKILAHSEEEKEAVSNVLDEFFILSGGSFHHDRCDDEIEKYKENSTAKARAGRASAEARRKKREALELKNITDAEQVLDTSSTEEQQNPTNRKPLTVNRKPLTVNQKIKTIDQSQIDQKTIDELFDQFWSSGLLKVGKGKAKKSFNNILKKTQRGEWESFVAMLAGDIRKRLSNKQFGFASTHPTTYLNGKRWEDEFTRPADRRRVCEEQEELHERLLRERGEDEPSGQVVSIQ